MKKAGLILLICVIVILIFLLYVFYSPGIQEKYIKSQLSKLNYCNVKEDCTRVSSKCPFGCTIYVNQKEVKKAENLIDSYRPIGMSCMYSCIYINDSQKDCINGKCMVWMDNQSIDFTDYK